MKRNLLRLALACALAGALMLAPVASAQFSIRFLTISTGPVGGEWYVLGGILSEILKPALPGVRVTATTGGGVANLSTVASAKSDIGTTQDQLLFEARKGMGDFADNPLTNVVGLCYLADIYMSVFLVREDMNINSLDDIAARKMPIRILTAPAGLDAVQSCRADAGGVRRHSGVSEVLGRLTGLRVVCRCQLNDS